MNCPTCFGIGEVLIDKDGRPVSRLRDAATMIACTECGGCGKIHCCEGDRAQPEVEESSKRSRASGYRSLRMDTAITGTEQSDE